MRRIVEERRGLEQHHPKQSVMFIRPWFASPWHKARFTHEDGKGQPSLGDIPIFPVHFLVGCRLARDNSNWIYFSSQFVKTKKKLFPA